MSDVSKLRSYADLLSTEWNEIREAFVAVVESSSIERVDWPDGFIGFADRRWSDDTPAAVQRRHDLIVRYDRWLVRFRLLFVASLPEIDGRIGDVDELVRGWLDRSNGNDWSVPTTVAEAIDKARSGTAAIDDLIKQAAPDRASGVVAIIDTNCLLRDPDLARFSRPFDRVPVELVFVPAVIRELDDLKDRGRSQEVRSAAAKAARRIKGLRDRGSLLAGVTVEGNLTARIEPVEPDFARLPTWLDPNTPDDRVLASTLTIQASQPERVVVLITNDLGLATKAEFNGIPNIDEPSTS